MKKLLIVPLFFIHAFLNSQARVNAPLPEIIDTGREFHRVTGWSLSPEGQWVSRSNRIPAILEQRYAFLIDRNEYGLGIDNIIRLKLYNVIYNNREYYLLEKQITDGQFMNPGTRQDWFTNSKSFFYVIEKHNFQFSLARDMEHTNIVPIFNHTDEDIVDVSAIPTILEPLLRGVAPRRGQRLDNLNIFTFYYIEDNVVRFFFNHGFPDRKSVV